jgi:hypothetical protein
VVSPPISLRRLERYDGQRVTYHYRSHKSERVEWERVDVYTFIGRMVQHVFPKGFQRIRYYGVQATKTFATLKGLIQEALARFCRKFSFEAICGMVSPTKPCCQGGERRWRSAAKEPIFRRILF